MANNPLNEFNIYDNLKKANGDSVSYGNNVYISRKSGLSFSAEFNTNTEYVERAWLTLPHIATVVRGKNRNALPRTGNLQMTRYQFNRTDGIWSYMENGLLQPSKTLTTTDSKPNFRFLTVGSAYCVGINNKDAEAGDFFYFSATMKVTNPTVGKTVIFRICLGDNPYSATSNSNNSGQKYYTLEYTIPNTSGTYTINGIGYVPSIDNPVFTILRYGGTCTTGIDLNALMLTQNAEAEWCPNTMDNYQRSTFAGAETRVSYIDWYTGSSKYTPTSGVIEKQSITLDITTTVSTYTDSTSYYMIVVPYTRPLVRSSRVYRAEDANGTADAQGAYIAGAYNVTCSIPETVIDGTEISGMNTEFRLVHRLAGDEDWTMPQSFSTTVTSGGNTDILVTNYFGSYSSTSENTYEIAIAYIDDFTSDWTVIIYDTLTPAYILMDFSVSGKGIAFGKEASTTLSGLDIDMPVRLSSNALLGTAQFASGDVLSPTQWVDVNAIANTDALSVLLNKITLMIRNIRYLGETTGWQALSLNSASSAYSSATTPHYRRRCDLVTLVGDVRPAANVSAGGSLAIGTLPEGCRPPQRISILCQGSGTAVWLCTINTDGTITAGRYRTEAGNQAMTTSTWLPFCVTFMV